MTLAQTRPGGQRDSNLELYRIIVMFFIIAHHYVVNSGLTAVNGPIYSNIYSWRSIFLLFFGAWGKTGINCFVLITGYYMCKSQIALKKWLKLVLEVFFYVLVICSFFCITGYEDFSFSDMAKAVSEYASVSKHFTSCYLLFYLFIPFLNILISNMAEKQHVLLITLLVCIYVLIGTFPKIDVTFNYVTWYCVLYFISSYIRLYPKALYGKTWLWGLLTAAWIVLALASILICAWVLPMLGMGAAPDFFLSDSNKILAVLISISSFLFFINLRIKQSTIINSIAGTTFGVLLIHANNTHMRKFLWVDLLNNVGMYDSSLIVIHAVGSVIGIFAACSIIDYLRNRFIEQPLFRHWDWWGREIEYFLKKYRRI